MLRKRHIFGAEQVRVNSAVNLLSNFFRDEPFWSSKPLFPPLGPSKELALMNYIEPLSDIIETDKEIKAKMEIPGVKKEDIKINATEDGVEVKCEKSGEIEEEDKKKGRYRLERNYSGFYRYFSLPESANVDKIEADYKDGILELVIPKTKKESKKEKEIKVK
jgi:HSP20 family molecular chaperone IbpA